MKSLLSVLILSLSLPVFAGNLTSVKCLGTITTGDGSTNVPLLIEFKQGEQYVESYSQVADWYNMMNPITSDSVINGERVITRMGNDAGKVITLFKLVIRNPNHSPSDATYTVETSRAHENSEALVCTFDPAN